MCADEGGKARWAAVIGCMDGAPHLNSREVEAPWTCRGVANDGGETAMSTSIQVVVGADTKYEPPSEQYVIHKEAGSNTCDEELYIGRKKPRKDERLYCGGLIRKSQR